MRFVPAKAGVARKLHNDYFPSVLPLPCCPVLCSFPTNCFVVTCKELCGSELIPWGRVLEKLLVAQS